MSTEKKYLTTNQVVEKLGLHRNTLTNPKYTGLLKPLKAPNNRDNLYDTSVIEQYIKDTKEQNPNVVFPFEMAKAE